MLYPKLTEKAAVGDMQGYKDSLNSVFSNVMLLLIPITIGFITVREPLLQLIANWGKITQTDIDRAAILVVMYSIGIVGIGAKEILDRNNGRIDIKSKVNEGTEVVITIPTKG